MRDVKLGWGPVAITPPTSLGSDCSYVWAPVTCTRLSLNSACQGVDVSIFGQHRCVVTRSRQEALHDYKSLQAAEMHAEYCYVRVSDELYNHSSCIGNTTVTSACMATGILHLLLVLPTSFYDDVKGTASHHLSFPSSALVTCNTGHTKG